MYVDIFPKVFQHHSSAENTETIVAVDRDECSQVLLTLSTPELAQQLIDAATAALRGFQLRAAQQAAE